MKIYGVPALPYTWPNIGGRGI